MKFIISAIALSFLMAMPASFAHAMAETEPVVKIDKIAGCWEYEGVAQYIVVPIMKPGTRVFILSGGDSPKLTFNGPSQAIIPLKPSGTGDWLRSGMIQQTGAYILTLGNDDSLEPVDMTMTVCFRLRDML